MALLNYNDFATTVLNNLNGKSQLTYADADKSKTLEWHLTNIADGHNDYIKLVMTGDGHIFTHGKDLLKDFAYDNNGNGGIGSGTRGLIPSWLNTMTNATAPNYVFRGTGWSKLIADPSEWTGDGLDLFVPNIRQMQNYMSQLLSAVDVMRFKGTITVKEESGQEYIYDSDDNKITKCEIGDTYRFVLSGNQNALAGYTCEQGDLIICIAEGEVKGSVTNLNTNTYWSVIQSNINGSAEYRVNGTLYYIYTEAPSNSFTIYAPITGGTQNQVLISKGDAAPDWVNQSKLTAGKVSNALTIGAGLHTGNQGTNITYDGSSPVSIALQPATASTLGVVIIGDNITLDTTTTIGKISITKKNVTDALGYEPINSSTAATYSLVVTNSATGDDMAASSSPFFNLVKTETVANNKTVVGSINLQVNTTDTALSISNTAAGVVTIGLGAAESSKLGGIKIGYSETDDKNYAVKLDANNKAFVTVPWTDTFRTVKVAGTNIGNAAINFVPSDDMSVYLVLDEDGKEEYEIGFKLMWYNLSTDKYEP